jgi:hypothetical protein
MNASMKHVAALLTATTLLGVAVSAMAHDPDEEMPKRQWSRKKSEAIDVPQPPLVSAEARAALLQGREDWSRERPKRRAQQQADLQTRWSKIADRAGVREELAHHGRRVAKLERLVFLSELTAKAALATRAKAALEREAARHEARMAALGGTVR